MGKDTDPLPQGLLVSVSCRVCECGCLEAWLVRDRGHATPGQGHYPQHKAIEQDAKGRVDALEEGNGALDKCNSASTKARG